MAIRIIEGVPGSGKTYYAVRHLAKNYFIQNSDGFYELSKSCTIITNIDSFQPDHLSLQNEIKNAGGVEKFFSFDFQEKFKEGKAPIVYIIDEAQRFFRKGQRGLADVFTYFEYHRHWGQDIYLVTQNARKLPPDLVYLTEYLIVAAPRTRSILGEFKYKWVSEGEIIKREAFRPDPGVFALYKSMDTGETEKIKNPVMKTVYMVFTVVICVIALGYWYFTSKWGVHPSSTTSVPVSPTSSKSVPVTVSNRIISSRSEVIEYLVPVSSAVVYSGRRRYITFIFQNNTYSLRSSPYPSVALGNGWYFVLPYSVFHFYFNEDSPAPPGVIVRQSGAGNKRRDLSGAREGA